MRNVISILGLVFAIGGLVVIGRGIQSTKASSRRHILVGMALAMIGSIVLAIAASMTA